MSHILDKTSAFRQGVVIFVYLAVLTVLEYFVAVTFEAVSILVIVAVIKVALVMYYYMHIYKLNEDGDSDPHSYSFKTATNRLGLWLFLLSDAFVFAGLLAARVNLLGLTRPHLNQTLGLVVTAVLLISSFFMNRGETAMAHGDKKGFMVNTIITFVLGLGFLLGVVAVEWPLAAHEGLTASSGAAGAVFYMMTGMHAFHVFTGLIFLIVVLNNGRKDIYSADRHWGVEAAAVYWHFVDLVWIFFYPALYLIGIAL
ncbi:MAG: cytochrome c oxidase subunit 3 [Anaerolineales bacterium]|nr:MAG: cytochrome c oxidase subunit 3 [Anaerolineales bacterium]